MARNIESLAPSTVYPMVRRVGALFAGVMAGPRAQPEMVADKVREILESGTTELRHPASPDAAPFLAWRAAMSDEQWTVLNSQSDADWLKAVKSDFGMELKLD